MKKLPTTTVLDPTPWESLKPLDRARALRWMLQGLDFATRKQITARAYRHLCYCVTNGIEFDPVSIWNGLAPRMQDHFAHTREAYDTITGLIDLEMEKMTAKPPMVKIADIDDDDDQEGIYDESE